MKQEKVLSKKPDELTVKIDYLKKKLYNLLDTTAHITSSEVVNVSQELDKMINTVLKKDIDTEK